MWIYAAGAHQLQSALAVWGLGGCEKRLRAVRRCMHVFCRVKQRDNRLGVPKTWCTSGMTTSRQFGTCRRRDGSPGDQKRQAGQRDGCFFKNTTRTIERSDFSLSFISSTAARVVVGQNTRPTGRVSFTAKGWLPRHWLRLLVARNAVAVQDNRKLFWRSHRWRCISLP